MEALGEFSCRDCSMAFHSLGLLEKHKAFFCIGSDIGDPVVLRQRHPERTNPDRDIGRGVYPKRTSTPDLIRLRERSMHLRNMRERASDTSRPPRTGREDDLRGNVSESLALRNLADEFHKLRMSIEESMPSLPKWSTDTETEQVLGIGGQQWGHRERMKEMAEEHDRQLAQIQQHNHHLETQREEIARQLGALAGQGSTVHLETLLLELREQEERNEETLQQLRDHITSLPGLQGAKEISSHSVSHSTVPPDDWRGHNVTFDLMSSLDGPLSTQIRALRLAYMQSGGSDPAVLAQMHDLQAEAHTLEQNQPGTEAKRKKKRMKPPQRAQNSDVLAVEQENQRLEEEIFRITLARDKHRGEEAVGMGLQQIQREHAHHMASIQAEIEGLRREVERAREAPRDRRQPPPPPPPHPFPAQPALHPLAQMHAPPALTQPRPHSSNLGRHVLDPLVSLGPAPYDPAAGFVIFYDLVVGVDATLQVLRLVAGLYSGGQEVGRPTPLPPSHCQPGGGLPYAHSVPPGNYAPLSVKQPVPRMQPSPSLSLVVELQAAGGVDGYGQEIQKLVARGWARLDLFDQHHQVQSGHWRMPVRSLPVRPSLTPGQLNSVPQVGNMELCLRVVNARDGDVQSLAKIDPSNTSQYRYPAMVSSHPATLQGNPPLPLSTLQPSAANHFFSLLPYNDHEDPPPLEESNQSDIDPSLLGLLEKGGRERLGISVDRVRGAPQGEGSLRLTGYSQRTGKVLMCGDSGLHCCTHTARTSIIHGELIFGEQQIGFSQVLPGEDMILILHFYHRPVGSAVPFSGLVKQRETPPWEEEGLVGNLADMGGLLTAWGVVRLTHTLTHTAGQTMTTWNTGTHSVPLYHVPVPPALALTTLPEDCLGKPFEPYGDAVARLHIYSGEAPLLPFPPEYPLASTITPTDCFQVSVDGALNLPWSTVTLGLCSLSPPGALYQGTRWVAHDPPAPIVQLDPSSSQSAPRWRDGVKSFHKRVYNQNLTAIIHLHAVSVALPQDPTDSQSREGQWWDPLIPTLSLREQCWTAVPIFTTGGRRHSCRYQLPLYLGSPSQAVLTALANGSCKTVLENLQHERQVQFLKGASVFVRVADVQGEQELAPCEEDTDRSLLPVDQLASYSPQPKHPAISQLIPTTHLTAEPFTSQLSNQYIQLVYRTLEEPFHFRDKLQLMGPSSPQ